MQSRAAPIIVPPFKKVGVGVVAFQRKKPAAIGVKAPFPGFVEPALATSIDKVPSGERWLHEIKFDGYRVQVHLQRGNVVRNRAEPLRLRRCCGRHCFA